MVIVTGGAGFIGSALVAELNKRGQTDILIVDRLESDEKWKNLRKLSYADYIEADDFFHMVTSGDLDLPAKTILHMGACSDTTERDCSYLANNNYEFTKILASWASQQDIRFIYASSAATYGDGELGFEDNEDQIDKLLPLNMYGYSKQMFDIWARNTGLLEKAVGLKFFNVFGPNEYHKANMRSFIMRAFEQITAKGKVKLFKSDHPDYGHGEQVRDFLYVKDCVDMTLFFMENENISGIFNIGTGQARTWNDLAKATFAAMNIDENIEYIDMPETLKGKYQYYTRADITKLRNAGYDKETTNLEDAIKDYVQNYLSKNEYLGA